MKKLFLCVFCCMMFTLAFSSCASDSAVIYGNGFQSDVVQGTDIAQSISNTEDNSPITFGVYRYGGISFGVPEGFALQAYDDDSASFVNPKNNVTLIYDKRKTSLKEKDFTENVINKLYGGYFPGSAVKLFKKINIGAAPGVYFEYGPDTSKSQPEESYGKDYMIFQSSVLFNGYLYSFIIYSDTANQNNARAYMDQLTESVIID